jgi:hypothetical protein
MARSSVALLAVVLGGCDLVFGIDAEETPCEVASFAEVTPVDVVEAEDFSFDWEETFGVVQKDGVVSEISPIDATLTPIDLGPYNTFGLSLAPEGNALFYTLMIEPLTLKAALRGAPADWYLDAGVPRGVFAGTPSADIFGPRRVMVRVPIRDAEGVLVERVQEYEDASGVWTAIGEPREMTTLRAPNLTPEGLTMSYPGFDEAGEPGLFVEQRTSRSAAFGAPVMILAGAYANAQLTSRCARLYATDQVMLRRYER